ncbi:MAG TPA: NUDIX domain-containing protein [Ilumatobacteraceae bacterium]|nr:NUDIX domain-containing protein [Ilumatobacteraceae bacterium]
MPEELVDIVDDDDHVITTVTRREMRANRLQHRGVGVAVMSTDGRLLAHRRSAVKDVWPGWWDIAAGGVVLAGETYDQAARRELAEELGVVGAELEYIGSGRFVDDNIAELCRGYRVVHDGPFTFDDGEVVEVRWVTFAELEQMRSAHPFLPDSITLLLPLLLKKFSD